MRKLIFLFVYTFSTFSNVASADSGCPVGLPISEPQQINGATATWGEMVENRAQVQAYLDHMERITKPSCAKSKSTFVLDYAYHRSHLFVDAFNSALDTFLAVAENKTRNDALRAQQMALTSL